MPAQFHPDVYKPSLSISFSPCQVTLTASVGIYLAMTGLSLQRSACKEYNQYLSFSPVLFKPSWVFYSKEEKGERATCRGSQFSSPPIFFFPHAVSQPARDLSTVYLIAFNIEETPCKILSYCLYFAHTLVRFLWLNNILRKAKIFSHWQVSALDYMTI